MIHRAAAPMVAALFLSAAAFGQDPAPKMNCEDGKSGSRSRACEIRETKVPMTGKLSIDAAPNGGINVYGWSKGEIFVRAKVEAWGDSDADAKSRMAQVKVLTDGGAVRPDGPKQWGRNGWSVSFEVFVPKKIDLALESVNGGIHLDDVTGNITFEAVNGGIHIARTGGKVKGETVNGGIHVSLDGASWQGESLDLETVNGGVHLNVPAGFGAQLHAETVNGGVHCDMPVTVKGTIGGKKIDATLGSGGAPVRIETVNGGIHIGTGEKASKAKRGAA